MSLRTPMAKVRGLGAAKSGTSHFWHQRLTALANVPLTIAALIVIVSLAGKGHAEAISTLSNPFVTLILAALILSTVWHMKLGMQMVIEDYVHSDALKLAALVANSLFSAGIGLAGIYALLKLNFGV